MCEQMNAYTLSDDATYFQRTSESLIPHLNITYQGDPGLFNQYSVIPVNATNSPHVNHALVITFKDWLVSQEGQDLIASYDRYGHQLFFPNALGYGPRSTALWIDVNEIVPNQILVRNQVAAERTDALVAESPTGLRG